MKDFELIGPHFNYLLIFIEISRAKHIELNKLCAKFGLKYQMIYKVVRGWERNKLVSKQKKEQIIMGQDKYEYSLTSKGTSILKRLHFLLQETLFENLNQDMLQILEELGLKLTVPQQKNLGKLLKTLLSS